MERQQRRLAAILAADVEGYSRLMGIDEAGTLARFNVLRSELIDPKIVQFRGRVVGSAGDSLLVEFASAVDAVQCAVEAQERIAARNADMPENRRFVFRMGINLGDVIAEGDTIHGDGVNVAARLERLAKPGTVVVARSIHDQVKARLPYAFADLGEHTVKNITEPVRAFCVEPRDPPVSAPVPVQAEGLPLPSKPSVAVLPFTNMSGDPEQEYFSDGITEDLITDLSKVSGLFVIARHSSFTYKGKAVRVQEVGRELGVRFVLEGSVRKAGNRARITAQLIDATSGGHLWADRFDRDLTDIFATQDEVVRMIVGVLAVKLTSGEEQRLRQRGTSSVEAYDIWLRTRGLVGRGTSDDAARARAMHRRAIEIDPNFAAPYAGLAIVAMTDYVNGWADDSALILDEAERLARRAVELNDQDPAGHMALGGTLMWRRDHDAALAEHRRSIELDPNFAQGYMGTGMTLIYAGRASEALESLATAMRLDPRYSNFMLHLLALAQYSLGQYETAADRLLQRITLNPNTDVSRMLLASCWGQLGRVDDARAAWAELLKVNPRFSLAQRARILPYKDAADFQRIADGLAKAGLV